MSSEAITRNDLTNILNEVLPRTMGVVNQSGVVSLYNDSPSNQGYWVYNTTFPL